MAPTERVSAAQRYDLAVVESHSVKDTPKVLRPERSVGEAAVLGTSAAVDSVRAAETAVDLRPPGALDGNRAGHRPDVGVAHARVLLLDGDQKVVNDVKTRVRVVAVLGLEAHCGAVASAAPVERGEGPR